MRNGRSDFGSSLGNRVADRRNPGFTTQRIGAICQARSVASPTISTGRSSENLPPSPVFPRATAFQFAILGVSTRIRSAPTMGSPFVPTTTPVSDVVGAA